MSRLTTHVLDTSHGVPAAGVVLELFRSQAGQLHWLARQRTNQDGRCEQALLAGEDWQLGGYQLHVHIGDYFGLAAPRFLDIVVIAFQLIDTRPCHIPLLCSPWSYSTYRGS